MHPRNLSWIKLKEYIDSGKGPLVIPVGSLEGHGAHLPINTDSIIAEFIADELARRKSWISLPPITYSIAVPVRLGNVWVEPEVFSSYLSSIIKHFIRFNQRDFIVVLGHGGPYIKNSLINACSKLCLENNVNIASFHIAHVLSKLGVDTLRDKHAGVWETSIVMYVDKELVTDPSIYRGRELRDYGVVGNPLKASPELGRELIDAVVNYISDTVGRGVLRGCYYDWV